jgi:2-dehydropantoate 2-reductase
VNVLVLGTGAMATLVGGRLARNGRAGVTLAGTWPEAIETISTRGLTVHEAGGPWRATARAVVLSAVEPGCADLVVALVKSHRTEAVAPVAARALARHGLALTLQNGLGNREALAHACGEGRVAAGVITAGATLLGPGEVKLNGPGTITLAEDQVPAAALAPVAELMSASGFPLERVAGAAPMVWRKLAVNCAINPLSAILGVPNGRLLESPEPRATLVAAAREVGEVASAAGIDIAADPVALALEVAALTASNRSSMLQDVERGAPTEIDALCGAVVREARRLGVAAPVNERLWTEIARRRTHEALVG